VTFDVGLLAFLWGATVARLPTLLRDRRQQAMWATLFAGTLTETSTFPPLARAIDWPILTHLLGAISAFVLLRFLALLSGARVRPWQVALTVAVVVTLVTLDLTTGGIDPSSGDAVEQARAMTNGLASGHASALASTHWASTSCAIASLAETAGGVGEE